MNLEFEVKSVLRNTNLTPERRAGKIMEFATFKKENIVDSIIMGGKTVSDIFYNIISLEKNR
jgi:hypothetical protein